MSAILPEKAVIHGLRRQLRIWRSPPADDWGHNLLNIRFSGGAIARIVSAVTGESVIKAIAAGFGSLSLERELTTGGKSIEALPPSDSFDGGLRNRFATLRFTPSCSHC